MLNWTGRITANDHKIVILKYCGKSEQGTTNFGAQATLTSSDLKFVTPNVMDMKYFDS